MFWPVAFTCVADCGKGRGDDYSFDGWCVGGDAGEDAGCADDCWVEELGLDVGYVEVEG